MQITTKYNIGDEVWVLHNHKAIITPVYQISTENRKDFNIIKYFLFPEENECASFEESRVFKTKEELIESL